MLCVRNPSLVRKTTNIVIITKKECLEWVTRGMSLFFREFGLLCSVKLLNFLENSSSSKFTSSSVSPPSGSRRTLNRFLSSLANKARADLLVFLSRLDISS